ncbi:MAG: autotransporter-associated beta strand repeat-containing protein [Luteolibacter sp.]
MKTKNKTAQHLGLIALAFAGVSSPLAQAASQTWTNSASDLLWNTTSLDWTGAAWTNNNDAVFGATGAGTIAVSSGVIVNDITFSAGTYTLTGNLMLANDQASTFTVNSNATISAIIANNTAGASSLTKAGTAILTLSNANTYSGGTTISAGTLAVGNNSALGTGGTSSVTLDGGTLRNSALITTANNIVVGSNGGRITLGSNNNYTLTGALSGSGNLLIGGAGTNNQSVNAQFSANTMTSGTITLNSASTGGIARLKTTASSSAAVDWVVSGGNSSSTEVSGTFNFGSLSGSGGLTAFNGNSGDTIYSVGALNTDKIYSGLLASIGTNSSLSLLKVGTGSWTLSGTNTFVTVGTGGASTTTVRDGSLIAGTNSLASTNGAFGNSATAIALGDATTISSGTAMNPKLLTGGAFTIGRAITVGASNGALGNAGTTFTIGGSTANASTFSGVTTLNQNLSVTQVASGTLNLTGNITSGSSGTQTVTLNNVGAVSQSIGVIGGGTGTIAVTQTGSGTVTLSGANTYTGATAVNAGTLKAGVASVANTSGAFGNNSAVTMANVAGATLDITGFNTQIGSLTGGGVTGGNVVLGAATLTTGGDNTSPAAYAGVISGTGGALTKIGTGTLTLTGTNSYTGNTTVNAGKLVVNGNSSTSVLTTVNSTATLGGSGTIGALTVMSGGTVAPGNSPGILSAGSTDLQAGSTLSMDINGSTLGSGYDQLNITGTVSLANALSLNLGGYTPVNSTLFFILANDGADAITGTFSNASIDGSTYTLDGQDFRISYFGDSTGGTFTGGNDVVLMAVPEPGAALLGGLGVLALLRRRRVS